MSDCGGHDFCQRDELVAQAESIEATCARLLRAAEAERDGLRDEVANLRAAMRHVIEDSPGTPDWVKGYLRMALSGEIVT